MNKTLRPGSWIHPAFFLLVAFSILLITLSGCHGGDSEDSEDIEHDKDSALIHIISLSEAITLTTNFRKTTDSFAKKCPQLADSLIFGYSESFNRGTYKVLLRTRDSTGHRCAGIRTYYGLGNDTIKLVMVPYDKNGNDILTHLVSIVQKQVSGSPHTEALVVSGAQAMEEGQHCPTNCPPAGSPLLQ